MSTYRGRFAPSPTGPIHLGTARTALAAWLAARASSGVLVMRVEDLDAPRVRPGALEQMLDDLRWLGLDWDEGPDVGGPVGPYEQSRRLDRYEAAVTTLERGGHLFACTCSRKEIETIASAPHGEDGPIYPGTCRGGPTHPERPAALRFRFEHAQSFSDAVHGEVAEGLGAGDFVVRRADGVFSYQLAVVVDDLAMQITEVVRGDDLLASTPRQLALISALGGVAPRYAHVPLVLGPDGNRLAKRHGAITMADLAARGVGAPEVLARLGASLGLCAVDEAVSALDLAARFEIGTVPTSPWWLADGDI